MIAIRQLFDLAQFNDVMALQRAIWGFAEIELVPLRLLVVISEVGGHVFGAYDGERMVGFCFALPGAAEDGRLFLHSHMLGVVPEYRDRGIGRLLKLRQREEALGRGIGLIEWTFDPLELKNAHFNIERLGAIVRRYAVNQYGITASPLHGGLPTDRCIAEWHLDSPRVRAVLAGTAAGPKPAERIAFPADIARLRCQDPAAALAVQQANGAIFRRAFSAGLAVTGFELSQTEGAYLLEPWS